MPTPTTGYNNPGDGNSYIPEATGLLQVEYSRAREAFPINRYAAMVPVDKPEGLYAELDPLEGMRVANADDYLWPDGQESPKGISQPLRWKQYKCEREAFPFTIGQRTANVADYDIIGAHARMVAQKAMTRRTLNAMNIATTSGNWPTANTAATVDALLSGSGLSWTSSSTTENTIKKSIRAMAAVIHKASAGSVKRNQLTLVVNPTLAGQMSETAEVIQYLVAHEKAIEMGLGASAAAQAQYDQWGLPPFLFGVNVVVEDTPYVSTRRDEDDSATTAYALADGDALLLARVGGGLGVAGAPSFSTLQGFVYEDMAVEAKVEDWDRLTLGRVVDDPDFRLASGISGFFLQDATT